MLNASQSEIYFIAGMFILTIVISAAATYFFIRTYKREKTESQRRAEKQKSKIEK